MRTRHIIRPPGPPGMNMSQRARLMTKQWALLALAFIILHVLLFVSWMIIGTDALHSLTVVAVVMMMYVSLFATLVVVFCQRLNHAADPVVYREARKYGQQAMAKVLEIGRTRWRVRRSYSFRLQSRPQRFEYQMRLRVTRAGTVDYDVDVAEYLSGDDVPERGDMVAVKVHPQYRDVVVLSRIRKATP